MLNGQQNSTGGQGTRTTRSNPFAVAATVDVLQVAGFAGPSAVAPAAAPRSLWASRGRERLNDVLLDGRPVTFVTDLTAVGVAAAAWSRMLPMVAFMAVALLAPRRSRPLGDTVLNGLPRLWGSVAVGALLAAAIVPGDRFSAPLAALTLAVLASLFRAMTAGILAQAHRRGLALRPTLVIGTGDRALTLADKIGQHRELGLGLVSVVSPGVSASDLPELIARWSVRELIVVAENADPHALSACLEACDGSSARVSMVPPLGEFLMNPRRVEQIGGVPVIVLGRVFRGSRLSPAKRAVDLLVAGAAAIALAPVMLVVAALIKLDSRGPVLFRQTRVGQGGRPFAIFKFRSMVDDADTLVIDLADSNESDGLLFKMQEDPRITRVGKWIRKLSIDELPQLLNVLRGDMSLVGPRPLPVSADSFGPVDGKRHNARPGITGLWQTSGRSNIGYDEMIKLDLAYIQHWSVWNDVQILLRTIPVVARGDGAY